MGLLLLLKNPTNHVQAGVWSPVPVFFRGGTVGSKDVYLTANIGTTSDGSATASADKRVATNLVAASYGNGILARLRPISGTRAGTSSETGTVRRDRRLDGATSGQSNQTADNLRLIRSTATTANYSSASGLAGKVFVIMGSSPSLVSQVCSCVCIRLAEAVNGALSAGNGVPIATKQVTGLSSVNTTLAVTANCGRALNAVAPSLSELMAQAVIMVSAKHARYIRSTMPREAMILSGKEAGEPVIAEPKNYSQKFIRGGSI